MSRKDHKGRGVPWYASKPKPDYGPHPIYSDLVQPFSLTVGAVLSEDTLKDFILTLLEQTYQEMIYQIEQKWRRGDKFILAMFDEAKQTQEYYSGHYVGLVKNGATWKVLVKLDEESDAHPNKFLLRTFHDRAKHPEEVFGAASDSTTDLRAGEGDGDRPGDGGETSGRADST